LQWKPVLSDAQVGRVRKTLQNVIESQTRMEEASRILKQFAAVGKADQANAKKQVRSLICWPRNDAMIS
jgi:hypothetical protein